MRSERRHHEARLKAARRHYWGRDLRGDLKTLGKAVQYPAICSCWLCRNTDDPKRQERSACEAWRKIEQA